MFFLSRASLFRVFYVSLSILFVILSSFSLGDSFSGSLTFLLISYPIAWDYTTLFKVVVKICSDSCQK